MRILTGDECGLLKETIPEHCRPKPHDALNPNNNHKAPLLSTLEGVRRVDPNESQRRARGVVDMSFTSTKNDSCSFAALRANGTIQLWESTQSVPKESFGTYQCTGVLPNVFETSTPNVASNKGRPIALDSLVKDERLCAADSLGIIAIVRTSASSAPSVVATYSPFSTQPQTLSYTKGSYVNTSPCTAMAVDSYHQRIALGGRERETRLLDAHTGQVVWKAKNLSPDPQTLLQHPVWSTALDFIDQSTMVVGTAFHQVKLYDVRTNSKTKRPIAYTPEHALTHRITALCPLRDTHQLVVGDASGNLFILDTRTMGTRSKKQNLQVARLVGPAGSVRQVVTHATLPMICTVGLDRMLRTYCLKRRKQVDCIYLKQRLNCVLIGNDDSWNVKQTQNVITEDYQGQNDVDADDEVQDYIDSSGEDEEQDEGDSDEQSEEDSDGDDDSQEDESSQESDEDEESDASNSASDLEQVTRQRDSKRQKRV